MINGNAVALLGDEDIETVAAMLHNLLAEVAALRVRITALETGRPDAASIAADVDSVVRRVVSRSG